MLTLHHMNCFAEKKPFASAISLDVVKNALALTDYFNEHQIQVWRYFEKESPINLNPFDRQVAIRVIQTTQKDEIYPGKIADQIDSKPKTVAGSFARIGLKKGIRNSKGTPYIINDKLLDQLKEVLC